MNRNAENQINRIIILIFLLNPVLDLVISLINRFAPKISIVGLFIRSLFLGFVFVYYFFIKKGYLNKTTNIIFGILFLYFLVYGLNIYFNKNGDIEILFTELKNLIKILYFPILFFSTFYLVKKDSTNFNLSKKQLLIILLGYCAFIIIPTITNTGFDSYSHSKTGEIGWFYSANEINAIIAVLLPFVFVYILEQKNKLIYRILLPVTVMTTIFILGTKTPLFALVITIIVYGSNYLINAIRTKNKGVVKFGIATAIVVIMSIIVIPFTPIYKNTIVHYKYLNLNSITDIFKSSTVFDHFIFGERNHFMIDTKNVFVESNLSLKLLGIGYINPIDKSEYKIIEMDFADIFFRTGIVMFITIFLVLPVLFIKNIQGPNYDRKKALPFILSLSIGILVSITAGHVLTSPSVATIIVFITIVMYNEVNHKELRNQHA